MTKKDVSDASQIIEALRNIHLAICGKMRNGAPSVRPIKNTTTQECYDVLYAIQEYLRDERRKKNDNI